MIRRKLLLNSVTVVLCLVLSGPVLAGNLVVNGGFETGDFTGWTLGGNVDGNTVVESAGPPGYDHWLPHSGTYFAALGARGRNDPANPDNFLSEVIATTAGQSYTFSWYLGSDGGLPNDFTALWNGTAILSLLNTPATPGYNPNGPGVAAYAFYSFTEVATGASTTIQFNSRNDPSFWAFDDVSVTLAAVPEPSSLVLSAIGILTLAGYAGRRRRRAKV